MAWIFDTYSMNKGHSVLGVVTGSRSPSAARSDARRRPRAARSTASRPQPGSREADSEYTVAIQGFGNVGANLARLLDAEGAKVVGLSDSTSGVHNADGIDVLAALAHKQEHGTLEGLPDADR